MELDDFKQPWKDSTEKINPLNINIMELIQNKSYGPLAVLKHRFRKQLIILPFVMLMLMFTLSKHHDIFSDVLFWCYVVICIMMCSYFFFSYRLISNMQYMEGKIKSNLEKQVHMLENFSKWRLIIVRIVFVAFIVLLEILMHYQQEPSLAKWHAQPFGLRIVCYAALFLVFYFFSKAAFKYKYGKHIQYLKSLVQQMQ